MRVELAGKGTPIPQIALPVVGGGLVPQVLLLSNGVPFVKASHIAAGYTNYEVWCIGAAGGRGGKASYQLKEGRGGAGGGGGLHYVRGLLADLPANVPVVVGVAGANGGDHNGLLPSHGSYIPASPGADGSASSFNGATCQASGGKGGDIGARLYIPPDGVFTAIERKGAGAEGGVGGRTLAGGGAAGSATDNVDGATGPWDGVIGKGGGGGKGGWLSETRWEGGQYYNQLIPATNGGNGSFAYDDLTVYGQRGVTQSESLNFSPYTWVPTPGSGGGAKLPNGQIFGSYSTGSSPHGAVMIRLTSLV